jgi:8-oxo-dGTP pyrophosphatase MutT (NUDIX family)
VLGTPIDSARLLGFAGQPSKFTREDFDPGHFTVSVVLADPEARQIYLIQHAKLGRWLQPGGHIEGTDTSIVAAAVREAEEEAGYQLDEASAIPVALSIHRIPPWGAEPSHLHLDLQFLFRDVAADGASRGQLVGRWFALDSAEVRGALEHTRDRVMSLLPR